jgi:hypothetical protein
VQLADNFLARALNHLILEVSMKILFVPLLLAASTQVWAAKNVECTDAKAHIRLILSSGKHIGGTLTVAAVDDEYMPLERGTFQVNLGSQYGHRIYDVMSADFRNPGRIAVIVFDKALPAPGLSEGSAYLEDNDGKVAFDLVCRNAFGEAR